MHDLGTLPQMEDSQANGINNLGQIVGASGDRRIDPEFAFLYDNGIMQNLNSLINPASGWTLQSTKAPTIPARSWATARLADKHAFLLTPVPEPSTFVLLAAGTIGLLGYAWRWRKQK